MPIKKAGHGHEDATRKTAKAVGWTVTREKLNVCEACTHAKAKQKSIYRKQDDGVHEEAKEVNGPVFISLWLFQSI